MTHTLETLATELHLLADAIEGPEEWGYDGFYAANFNIQATERHQFEALINRLEPLTYREDVYRRDNCYGNMQSVAYTIGENSSIGFEIHVVGPSTKSDAQARIAELEEELEALRETLEAAV